ncbi:hypothetical protein NGA_2041620, partial [Nannochloropsis gaditana CCMP526]|uniref:uncharacterized protein n=1 Tax=Nannochloropsis gaditana (strain CCMP526) TaxID=1093141 RepID=UPI00029F6C8B
MCKLCGMPVLPSPGPPSLSLSRSTVQTAVGLKFGQALRRRRGTARPKGRLHVLAPNQGQGDSSLTTSALASPSIAAASVRPWRRFMGSQGMQRRPPHQIRQVCPGKALRLLCQLGNPHVLRPPHALPPPVQDVCPILLVWQPHVDEPVEAPGPQKGGVDGLRCVGRRQHRDKAGSLLADLPFPPVLPAQCVHREEQLGRQTTPA